MNPNSDSAKWFRKTASTIHISPRRLKGSVSNSQNVLLTKNLEIRLHRFVDKGEKRKFLEEAYEYGKTLQ